MKTFVLVVAMIVIGIVVLICWERWDEQKDRGHTWGYWGEFNSVSNCLAKLQGVIVVKAWHNADFLVLEEFGLDLVFDGKPVSIAFGEKGPVRRLSGPALETALMEMIKKESSNRH